jgi:hypothetical protein
MKNNSESTDRILGIDRKIIESFLELIRDKYKIVDEANYFLESRTGASGVNIAIVNQRDFTSHLCTLLQKPELHPEQQAAQLSAAEEHLRRAIIESYQRSLNIKLVSISEILDQYKMSVIPKIGKNSDFKDAPNYSAILNKLKTIRTLQTEGRNAKSINLWDKNWENGIKVFISSFDVAEELESTIENYLFKIPSKTPPWKTIVIGLLIINILLSTLLLI